MCVQEFGLAVGDELEDQFVEEGVLPGEPEAGELLQRTLLKRSQMMAPKSKMAPNPAMSRSR